MRIEYISPQRAWIPKGCPQGDVHTCTNQYEAQLTVQPIDSAWKVTRLEILQGGDGARSDRIVVGLPGWTPRSMLGWQPTESTALVEDLLLAA